MATTTPNYGWPVPTSTDYVKDGAVAIEALGDAIDATVFGLPTSGLTLIKSQVIGTTVASVNVTSAFSTTYENYRIIVSGGVSSGVALFGVKLGATTTGYYQSVQAITYAAAGANAGVSNGSSFTRMGVLSTTSATMDFDLQNPFTAKITMMNGAFMDSRTTGEAGFVAGFLDNTTSYTDFTITPASGTLTGGTIYVYGYKK